MKVHPALSLDRRRLLLGSVASLAIASSTAGTNVSAASPRYSTPDSLQAYAPAALAREQLDTLKAATDRIIPPDELGPGATEAGVFVYIDRGLSGYFAHELETYREGLHALDAAAHPARFAELDGAVQDELLAAAERGELPGAPPAFFLTLLNHTREGMFSDPIHGGNVDFAGWDLIGYSGLKLVWTDEEQALDTDIPAAHASVVDFGGTIDD